MEEVSQLTTTPFLLFSNSFTQWEAVEKKKKKVKNMVSSPEFDQIPAFTLTTGKGKIAQPFCASVSSSIKWK